MHTYQGRRHSFESSWLRLIVLVILALVLPFGAMAQDEADCAEVKIVIEQKLSLERQAFDAHMIIHNGLDDALSDVSVELTFLDRNQQPVEATADPNAVGATFFQRIDRMTGIGSINGSQLAGKTDADIHWLIIPSQGAGGDSAEGRMYYIGAKVTYTLAGETTTVDVTPDYVVVRPQPLLVLDYFLPTDVYADDAMTPEVEPIEPFTLGVRIRNVGAGTSVNTMIDSAQPKIVENHQGLLIDFRILGGYVGNDVFGKSLLLNFGDISGQSAKIGRWVMETTLAGRFTEFDASFTHADSLGGAVTSLIKEVHAHRLVHDVLVDLPGHDDVYDFLAEFGSGYRVYDSGGKDAEVADASSQVRLTTASGDALHLTFPASAILTHAKAADPFNGKKPIARVIRSDGKVLPANNFWLSKTRNQDLSWSYFLHVFDSHSTGDYRIEFGQGVAGSISGTAYRDVNNNGVHDAGEQAEGNLDVTLKGVDERGQNVLHNAYTSSSGTFQFINLQPGRYQLEAAVVNGLIDGSWTAGSAGGAAQPGLIKDIVLTAGTAGTGYLIAKRSPDAGLNDDDFADVSVAVHAERSSLRSDETTDVVITVRNNGEATAQAVVVQAAVPEGLTLQSAAASLGRYAGSTWIVGGLIKGQTASLTLTVKADKLTGNNSRSISWPVSASSSTADSQPGNNNALLGMTVQADNAVDLSQILPAESRVLMLISCPQTPAAEQQTCEQAVEQTARATLAGTVDQLQFVTTLAAWHVAQRSGAYNVLWLHGGAEKLNAQALAEVQAAVRRGATLIADGLPGAASGEFKLNQLAHVWGAKVVEAAIGSDLAVKFPHEPAAQLVVNTLYGLQLNTADEMAVAAIGNAPVMASATWGHGQSWLMSFDLLASQQGQNAAFWQAYFEQQLTAFTPSITPDSMLAGSRLPVKATVHNTAEQGQTPQNIGLRMQWPEGIMHTDVTPAAQRNEARLLEWNWTLESDEKATAAVTLTLPQTSTHVQLQTTLLDSEGETLDTITQPVVVLGLDTVIAQVDNALSALNSGDAVTQDLIQTVRQAVLDAKAVQQQDDWEQVLRELAAAQTGLDALAIAPHTLSVDVARLEVARWFGLAQQQWTKGGTGGTSQPAKLEMVSGDGQSAPVSTAFAHPLQIRVTNHQGQPVANVKVSFQAPTNGASALLDGDISKADIMTDDQGLASITPAANAVVGSYRISAQVAGLAPVQFELGNRSAHVNDTPATLLLVSGGDQTALIDTAFTAPLVVQVRNAADQPVTGVSVRFAFNASGASARFAGDALSVSVITDANGMASSPEFIANQVTGLYQAQVHADGVPALSVALANAASPVVDTGKQFVGTTATGTGAFRATVAGGGDSCRFNPNKTQLIVPGNMWTPLQKFLLPHGMFDFELVGCNPGSEVTVSTTWPDLRGVTGYMKYGKTPLSKHQAIWYAPKGLKINLASKTITYTIRDGELGDDDLAANGIIRDPGGPSVARKNGAIAVPTLDRWALWLLAALLGGFAMLRLQTTRHLQ